jgi:hypothetical protein
MEAKRLDGSRQMCSFTFPVGRDTCSFLIEWLEHTTGIARVDGRDPRGSSALGVRGRVFESNKWYGVRVRVSAEKVEAWLNDEKVVDLVRNGRRFTPLPEYRPLGAFGVQTWHTAVALRGIRLRNLERQAAPRGMDVATEDWQPLFDGRSLRGWRLVENGEYRQHGVVRVKDGEMVLEQGNPHTAVAWDGDFPRLNYEVEMEVKRLGGPEFCTATFPVGDSLCALSVGGWGARILGLSFVDGRKATENETKNVINFEYGRWYRVRLRVTRRGIETWLDGKRVIDLATDGRRLTAGRSAPVAPFGLAAFRSSVSVRALRLRRVTPNR